MMFGMFFKIMWKGGSRWEGCLHEICLDRSWQLLKLGEGGLILLFSLLLYMFESFCHNEFEAVFMHPLGKKSMIYILK